MNSDESGDSRLDHYLDGTMSQQESADFVQNADTNEMEQAMELQARIDDSLKRILSGLKVNEQEIEEQFLRAGDRNLSSASTSSASSTEGLPRGQWVKMALAATLLMAIGLGIWFNSKPGMVEPVSEVRPLTDVYTEKLADFTPYYFCEDDQRFADTFEHKLGMALALAEMPSDRRMTGLSYLGGISRDSVAMLCVVQRKEVIVFVDRDGESGIEEAIKSTVPNLNVFVERKFGLVFVEVTPLESAMMIEYFETAK